MRNSLLLTIVGFGLLIVVLIPLDVYATNLVETNLKQKKEVYSFGMIAQIQDLQFTLCGMSFGIFGSSLIIQLKEAIVRSKEKKSNQQ